MPLAVSVHHSTRSWWRHCRRKQIHDWDISLPAEVWSKWEARNPIQGHQQADKYSIPIPTLPCKVKKINSKQTSCPQLSGYEVPLVPDALHDCQEMLLLNLLKMGELLQSVAFLLGFISKTLGEGRNLLLAGGNAEFPTQGSEAGGSRLLRPKAGSWLLQEHPDQVCSAGSCVSVAGCKETTKKTKDPPEH